ncbi:MAG: class I SAM-dependent methyltransferase, partial [Candidatus Woesearchaeota archaeon]
MSNYYDEISEGYDELHQDEQTEKILLITNNVDISSDSIILDIGGGTGILSVFISAKKIVNLEPSQKMIDVGIKKQRNFIPICDVAENTKNHFKEDEFDYVVSLTAMHHITDRQKVFDAIKHVSKKNALIIISLLKRAESTPLIIDDLVAYFNFVDELISKKDVILILKNNK